MLRFAVIGAGAIGGYLGASLARGGADVTLIARGAHLQAMQLRGISIISDRGDFNARPQVAGDFDALATADVVFIGLKAPSLPVVLPEIAPLIRSDAVIVPLQNGVPWWFFQGFKGPLEDKVIEAVDPAAAISRAIDRQQVVGCISFPAAEIVAPGVIRHVEGTRFVLGELDGARTRRIEAIAGALIAGGLKAPVDTNLREQLWLKLIGNVAFNTTSAITGTTLAEFRDHPSLIGIVRATMQEVANVGAALGIELPVSIDRRLEGGLAVGNHKTSMLQDLEAGKPLELDCMSGAVLEIGRRLGMELPHVATLDACARAVAARAGA